MKKIILLSMFMLVSLGTKSSNYEINEEALNNVSAKAKEVSFEEFIAMDSDVLSSSAIKKSDKTKGGFLVRSFFLGCIALHRYYMGVGDASGYMWALYLFVPLPVNLVDFCGGLFSSDFYKKFENNSKYIVWL